MSGYPSRDVMDAEVRKVIAMARELAGLKAGELAAHTGSDRADVLGGYAAALGEAKTLLRALADIAERLSGQGAVTGEGRDRQWGNDPATRLIEAAFFLRQNGERPPGAPADDPEAETWGRWDREAEVFLRVQQAMEEAARRESDAEAWGGRGPSASYAEWLAEGRDEAGRGAAETGP